VIYDIVLVLQSRILQKEQFDPLVDKLWQMYQIVDVYFIFVSKQVYPRLFTVTDFSGWEGIGVGAML
jgi:hypothetical protein